MHSNTSDIRREVASAARGYLEHRITWQEFMDQMSEFEGDELIDELVDLIEHEPKKGGFMGINERDWQEYQGNIRHIIGLLNNEMGDV